ncbi:receptor-type guanylate cyclase gcy-28-like [Paramacrobiotus metropolitanus]|uniref:receptor-type guanylate cyclase gcy-28-like n=1 Tax=Paramacrobiotus metropolitanus TaxID=2943436 RepID=UPI0024462D0E|nr:receptor-type guanylate cyclase gcy-28-like [Paramacrobiotus metropolitanus]
MFTCIEAANPDLEEKGYAPTWVTSSMLAYDGLNSFIVEILARFKWRSVYMIRDATADVNPWFGDAYNSVMHAVRSNVPDNQISGHILTEEEVNATDFRFLQKLQETSRIVLYFGNTARLRLIAHEMFKRGMMASGEYVVIAVEPYPSDNMTHGSWGDFQWEQGDSLDADLEFAWRSIMLITLAESESERKTFFAPRFPVWANMSKDFYGFDIPSSSFEINFSQVMAYEGMLIFLKILEETIQEGDLSDITDGRSFAQRFHNRTIELPSGNVTFSKQGNRYMDLLLRDWAVSTQSWKPVLKFVSVTRSVIPLNDIIDWPNTTRNTPPLNEPLCGYTGAAAGCIKKLDILPFVAGVTALAIAILAGIGGFAYSEGQQQRDGGS